MSRIPRLDDCEYYTDHTDSGQFVGRVKQFPKLRTRSKALALDARDDIVSMTRDKLARLNDAAMGHDAAPGQV